MAGCGKQDDSKFVGDWHGTFKSATASISGGDLNLGAEHHFRLVVGDLVYEGSWSRSEKVVRLQPETINGRTVAEAQKLVTERGTPQQREMFKTVGDPIPLTVSDDGSQLTSETVAGGHTEYRKS